MLIINDDENQPIRQVTLLLSPQELLQLASYAKRLAIGNSGDHSHCSSSDYRNEITLYVCDADNTVAFADEARQWISQ